MRIPKPEAWTKTDLVKHFIDPIPNVSKFVDRQRFLQNFIGRVAAGSYPPAAPTDPGVPHSGTRLLR